MELQKLDYEFTICKIDNLEHVDFSREYVFLSKTDDEISLVCESAYVPPHAKTSKIVWRGFRISGILDFEMIGVIAKITDILANADISVFVVSTYNTDYFFVNIENFDASFMLLTENGYTFK